MHSVHELIDPKDLLNEDEAAEVREQMERLLQTHHFRNSRRYPALLRFIVEETLEGRGEHLKERLLGIKVFDRPADYDTAADPIVRVTIAEIRKRIAQYYHDEEHDSELRIELLPGRYMPEFRLRKEKPASISVPEHRPYTQPPVFPAAVAEPVVTLVADVPHEPLRAAQPRYVFSAAAVALVIALLTGLAYFWPRSTAIERMWTPVLGSSRSVLFCLPTDVGKPTADQEAVKVPSYTEAAPSAQTPVKTFLDFEAMGENVVYSDMMATLDIANVLAVHHHDYRVRLNTTTTLDDLRVGPTVLIGGLDNPWTMRALAPLRFHFAGSDSQGYWIADEKDPAQHNWSLDLRVQYQKITRDYAIVARLHNQQTGQPEMVVAGIGMSGTAAAGGFLADEAAMRDLEQRIGPGFKDRDMEVVLSTDVVNGISGSAKVLTATSW